MNRNLFEKRLKELNMSIMKVAMVSNIAPSDMYQAIKGNKPFFPKWRKSVCKTLDVNEEDLFPKGKGGGV